mmetsp:Transcript_12835/g.25090  ORF Transcript_12835/g.25090 Transcript_12835/m.25090 type:complete len:97 (-) Transcript_12835:1214-1504(-)
MVNLLIATTIAYRVKSRFIMIWNKNDSNEKDFYTYHSNHAKILIYDNENKRDYLLEIYDIFAETYYENLLKTFISSYTSTIMDTGFNEFLSFVESC